MSKRADPKSHSQRQSRVGELVRHALADALTRGDVQDPVLASHIVTVPEVRMSPDLRLATAYVMPLGGVDETPVLEALDRNKKALRAAVSRRLSNLRYAPDLRFRRDETFDEGARIDALLRSEKVRRDTAAPPENQPPHAEVAGEAGPRSTQDRGASFEASLRGAPQDEDVEAGRTHE